MKHFTFPSHNMRVRGYNEAQALLAPLFLDREEEFFVALLFDNRLRVIKALVKPGTINSVDVVVADLTREIIASNATAVVIAHNHPSEIAKPSKEDLAFTSKLRQVCEAVDVTVLDHLIFTSDEVFSFRRSNLL